MTHKIIGCALQQVHSSLGNGFPSAAIGLPTAGQEVIYQPALAIELTFQALEFAREMEIELFYRNEHIGTRRVDFFAQGKLMVEINKNLIHPKIR